MISVIDRQMPSFLTLLPLLVLFRPSAEFLQVLLSCFLFLRTIPRIGLDSDPMAGPGYNLLSIPAFPSFSLVLPLFGFIQSRL